MVDGRNEKLRPVCRGNSPQVKTTNRMAPRTLFEKIWDAHLVREIPGQPSIIYIDRHLIHEGTSPQAFAGLKAAGRKVRRPELTFAVMDHSVSTKNRLLPVLDADAAGQFEALARNCEEHGVHLFRHAQQESRNRAHHRTRSWASRSRAKRSSAATATPPRTALSAPSLSASEPAKSSTCSPRSASRNSNRRRWKFASPARNRAASPPKI